VAAGPKRHWAKISDDARQIKQLRTKSEAHRALSVAELAKYKASLERLNKNVYAVRYEPDQEKQIERVNHFNTHFDQVPNSHGARKMGLLLDAELALLPVEQQRQARYDMYKHVKEQFDEANMLMLNYNEKVPLKIKYKMFWANRKNGPKQQAMRQELLEKYSPHMREPGSPLSKDQLVVRDDVTTSEELFIEHSDRRDPTVPTVHANDLRDYISWEPWTPAMRRKRIRSSVIWVSLFACIFFPVYADFRRQRETGGFQGVYLGDKKLF